MGMSGLLKRCISALLMLLFAAAGTVCAFASDSRPDLSLLRNCGRIYAYSTDYSAYFYGFDGSMLYSARVLPDDCIRYVNAGGTVRAVSHDNDHAYALFSTGNQYSCLSMNMNDGSCFTEALYSGERIYAKSFCAADDEMFVMLFGRTFSYVQGKRGGQTYRYAPDCNIKCLFTNDDNAYLETTRGDVYRIGEGNMTFCLKLDEALEYTNAGAGYLYSKYDALVSLDGSKRRVLKQKQAAISEDVIFSLSNTGLTVNGVTESFASPLLLAASGGKAAVLENDYSCSIVSADGENNDSEQGGGALDTPDIKDGIVRGISSGTTVAAFKRAFPSASDIFSADGALVSSGDIKTGYKALIGGSYYPIAVFGDLGGSAEINSTDINALGNMLAEQRLPEGVYFAASDLNGDGSVDTRDLVLLMKLAK